MAVPHHLPVPPTVWRLMGGDNFSRLVSKRVSLIRYIKPLCPQRCCVGYQSRKGDAVMVRKEMNAQCTLQCFFFTKQRLRNMWNLWLPCNYPSQYQSSNSIPFNLLPGRKALTFAMNKKTWLELCVILHQNRTCKTKSKCNHKYFFEAFVFLPKGSLKKSSPFFERGLEIRQAQRNPLVSSLNKTRKCLFISSSSEFTINWMKKATMHNNFIIYIL